MYISYSILRNKVEHLSQHDNRVKKRKKTIYLSSDKEGIYLYIQQN